jgi:hypothetical protein
VDFVPFVSKLWKPSTISSIVVSPFEFGSSSWIGLALMVSALRIGRSSTSKSGGLCWWKDPPRIARLSRPSCYYMSMRFEVSAMLEFSTTSFHPLL